MTDEKEKAFGDGFDAGQNEALSYIGPMLDDWDRLSNDEKAQVQTIAPLFVQKLIQLRQTMDSAGVITTPPQTVGMREALFMCAASCQGGHSTAGKAAAEVLGVPYPIRLEQLVEKAIQEGLDPDQLWPWAMKNWEHRPASTLSRPNQG